MFYVRDADFLPEIKPLKGITIDAKKNKMAGKRTIGVRRESKRCAIIWPKDGEVICM